LAGLNITLTTTIGPIDLSGEVAVVTSRDRSKQV
jgi:hypothetical protein